MLIRLSNASHSMYSRALPSQFRFTLRLLAVFRCSVALPCRGGRRHDSPWSTCAWTAIERGRAAGRRSGTSRHLQLLIRPNLLPVAFSPGRPPAAPAAAETYPTSPTELLCSFITLTPPDPDAYSWTAPAPLRRTRRGGGGAH